MKSLKRILYILAVVLIVFTSCEKKYETEGLSEITYYAVFTMTGDAVMAVALGSGYTDPGCTADANGTNIPVEVSVSGAYQGFSGTAVDANTADKYIVSYSAENADGYVAFTERTVWVAETGDLTTSIEGLYSATVIRNGVDNPQYYDMAYVLIWEVSAGVYQISDAIGGYYALGRGYGDGYAAQGMTITANDIPTNDFTFGDAVGVGAFGGVLVMNEMTVDAVNKTIHFVSDWTDNGMVFDVTLTQVEI